MNTHIWTVADAKAKFSEVLEKAKSEGPQVIRRRGQMVAVVVTIEEWEGRSTRKRNLAEFLMSAPLRGSGIGIKPLRGLFRKIDL